MSQLLPSKGHASQKLTSQYYVVSPGWDHVSWGVKIVLECVSSLLYSTSNDMCFLKENSIPLGRHTTKAKPLQLGLSVLILCKGGESYHFQFRYEFSTVKLMRQLWKGDSNKSNSDAHPCLHSKLEGWCTQGT